MRCRECQEDKPEDQFAYKFKARGLRQTICRPCSGRYSAKHYRPNMGVY